MSQSRTSTIIKKLDQTYEFDREPIVASKLHRGSYFAGLFSGEHVAATEFVIGAWFVSWGARATDIVFGLLLGNLLAVLSWTLVTAPIAVQTRLTLYWYLRKIAGPYVTVLYNLLNAVLYCVLAGAMITVSASAVRLPFHIPPQTHWYPEDIRFILVVLLVGVVVVSLAILGFKRLAQFAVVCSPWMFIMFIGGALACLPALAASVPEIGHVKSLTDFWNLAQSTIWSGGQSVQGNAIGFWHVAAFAWICNLAMHLGLSDLAIFRYAKKSSYGLYSSFGMFLGHYLAWIAAGIMGAATAVFYQTALLKLDSGQIAYYALGVAGAITVVLAGWTTANPTLYRAGLALQVISPGWPRWRVTLIAGAITTVIACFPFVFTKLLDFVGIYGLLLVPMGIVVFVEHWIFPKIGLTRYWASQKGLALNWPALLAWVLAIAVAVWLRITDTVHLFFLLIPVWLTTSITYIVFAAMAGAREKFPVTAAQESQTHAPIPATTRPDREPARTSFGELPVWVKLMGLLALVALMVCLGLPLQVFLTGTVNYEAMKTPLLLVSLVYFISGTIYLIKKQA